MIKYAHPDQPIQPLLAQRWSPYSFDGRPVDPADLLALFEAARWAASSYNAQPWRYIVAQRGQPGHGRVLACLVDANQAWARHAPVLALGVTNTRFPHNGKENAAAQHDLGLAAASLSLEATARGIAVHQMIGLYPDKVRDTFALPDGFLPLTALAIGYPGANPELAPEVAARDVQPRARAPLSAFVFGTAWGTAAEFVCQDAG